MEEIGNAAGSELFQDSASTADVQYENLTAYRIPNGAEPYDDNLMTYASDLEMLTPTENGTEINPTDAEAATSAVATSSANNGPSTAPQSSTKPSLANKEKPAAKSTGPKRQKGGRKKGGAKEVSFTPEQIIDNLKQSVEALKAVTPILIKTRALKEPVVTPGSDGSVPSFYKYGLITDSFLNDAPPQNLTPAEAQQSQHRLDFVVDVDSVLHSCSRDALSALGVNSVYRSFWNDCRVYAELGSTTRWYPLHEWLNTRVRTGTEIVAADVLRQPDEIPRELPENVKAHLAALPLGRNRRKEAGPRRRSPDLAAAEAARLATQPAPASRTRKRPLSTQSDDDEDDFYIPPLSHAQHAHAQQMHHMHQMQQMRHMQQMQQMQMHHDSFAHLQPPLKQAKLVQPTDMMPLYEGVIPLPMGGIVIHNTPDGHQLLQMGAIPMGGFPMGVPVHLIPQPDHHHHHHIPTWGEPM